MHLATLTDPDRTAHAVVETVAFHTDDAGQRFVTAILDNGDVVDADLLDVTITAAQPSELTVRDYHQFADALALHGLGGRA